MNSVQATTTLLTRYNYFFQKMKLTQANCSKNKPHLFVVHIPSLFIIKSVPFHNLKC